MEFAFGTRKICLPVPDLNAWSRENPIIVNWRGIQLPQVSVTKGEYPDILGVAFYLFHDLEEIRQEAAVPEERFDITRSNLRSIYQCNYLDRLVSELKKDLQLSTHSNHGVILTHDLDFLSLKRFHLRWPLRRNVFPIKRYGLGKKLPLVKAHFVKVKRLFHWLEEFEFLNWVDTERKHGYASVFFVFADRRKQGFEGDAWYHLNYRNRKLPFITLRKALRGLLQEGFLIGLHLSRSSDYRLDQIIEEFNSLTKSMGQRVVCTRNHWLWIQYSNWHSYLSQLDIRFDFNVATQGYAKGTTFPYLAKNYFTVVFPTTYMDDMVFKENHLFLSRKEALDLLNVQLDNLAHYGGCTAISFHPAEDGPPETLKIRSKLAFYEEVLKLLSKRRIQVYLPEQAKEKFFGNQLRWHY